MRRQTLRERIEARIAERRDDAFLTREFRDLAGERQVLRALRDLTDERSLIRLGCGAYGRAQISWITEKPIELGADDTARLATQQPLQPQAPLQYDGVDD